ncbi:MAG: hypothetical protein LQ343_005541 [Gyalolechia ehrenbergii]|nr:MAG: hypothetical protein LQ343_005541 [Gyalolechia ehrenbergii]
MTNGRGTDVVLNSLGGGLLRTTWDCVVNFGRLVELEKLDIRRHSHLDMATFSRSTTFTSVDLEMFWKDKPALIQDLLREVVNLFRRGLLRNISPINVRLIDALGSALNDLQRGKTIGKTVVEPLAGQEVQVMPFVCGHPLILPDATYLITGGVGGMTKWLLQQSAKSVVLLSRSGHTSANARLLFGEYNGINVNLSVQHCDVGNEDQVREVVEECSRSMPLMCGVIHDAMVLHDKLFEQIPMDEYEAIMRPKVQEAWNLHNALSNAPVDFFVMLASAAGILSTREQASYAGAVAEVGYVAERSDRQGAISTTYGDKGLTERKFLAFLRAAMDNQYSTLEI